MVKRNLVDVIDETEIVLLDIDGTLLDTLNSKKELFNDFLKKRYGIDASISLNEARKYASLSSLLEVVSSLITDFEIENPDIGFAKSSFEDMMPRYARKKIIYPGCVELIEYLKDRNKRIALVTNAAKSEALDNALILEERCGRFYDALVSFDDVGKPKPEYEFLKKTFEALNVNPTNKYIIIGDTAHDVMLAKGINFGVAIYLETLKVYESKDFPTQPDFVFKDMKSVYEALIIHK